MAIVVPPIRILIVDDDKSICEYVQTLLERDGFQVETQCDHGFLLASTPEASALRAGGGWIEQLQITWVC